MRYTNGCLRLMIYMVYIDFITSIIGVLNYTIIQNIGLSLVRYRIAWPPLLASGVSLPSHVNGPIFLYIYIYIYIYIYVTGDVHTVILYVLRAHSRSPTMLCIQLVIHGLRLFYFTRST